MYVLAAIPISREIRDKIAPLQAHDTFIKLLRPSRMELHITLKAPQEISDEDKDAWVDAAKEASAGFGPVDLEITGLDFITTTVLALSIDPKPLQALHDALAMALEPYNKPGDALHEGKRYHPHITVGRALRGPLDASQRRQLIETLSPIAPTGVLTADLVRLYGREENAYRPLLDIRLTGNL